MCWTTIQIPRDSFRGLIARWVNNSTLLANKEKKPCAHILIGAIAISYHCPVAAMPCTRAVKTWRGDGARSVGTGGIAGREGWRRGRWHRLFRSQVAAGTRQPSRNICRYFPGVEHKRTTDFSSLAKQKAHPPTDTNRQSVCRGSVHGPSFLFRIFFQRHILPSSTSDYVPTTSVSFIPAARSKIFNFGRWHVPSRIIPSLCSSFSSLAVLCKISLRWNYSRATKS